MSGGTNTRRSKGDSESFAANPLRQHSLHTFFKQSSQIDSTTSHGDKMAVSTRAKGSSEAGCSSTKKAITSLIIKEESGGDKEGGLTSGHKRASSTSGITERIIKISRLEFSEQDERRYLAPDTPSRDATRLPKGENVVKSDSISSIHGIPRSMDMCKFEGEIPVAHVSKSEDGSEVESYDARAACTSLITGTGRRVPAPLQASEDTLTEYEKERLENVRRNQLFLQNLGIYTAKDNLERSPAKPKRHYRKSTPAPGTPLRRSRRRLGLSPPGSNSGSAGSDLGSEELDDQDEEEVCFDDSSVEKYICDAGTASCQIDETASMDWSVLAGYRTLPGLLFDPFLTKIYTMDMATFSDGRKGLLAAGGHKGQVAIFGTSSDSHFCPQESTSGVSTFSGEHERLKLLSWKAGSGWISQVQFLSQQAQDATCLLTSSNDGSVVLWNLKKHQSGTKADHTVPQAVAKTRSLHSNGIFTMHELDGRIVTGSKDSSLAYSILTETTITQDRVISGHHTRGIRGARFRDTNLLADCGADGLICILDLRLRSPCVSTINTLHTTPVNVVEWSPMQKNLLLSASNDRQLHIYDIRRAEAPIFSLDGHVKQQLTRCRNIYRPTFVGDGSMVITPGEGSKMLTLYSMSTGKLISRGLLGFDPSLVMGTSRTGGTKSNIWAAGSHIVQLAPMVGERICKT